MHKVHSGECTFSYSEISELSAESAERSLFPLYKKQNTQIIRGIMKVANRQPLKRISLPGKSNIAKIRRKTYNSNKIVMPNQAAICFGVIFIR